jgi:hypothetical protein
LSRANLFAVSTSETTKLALARALGWTLLELEKAIVEKNNGRRKGRR